MRFYLFLIIYVLHIVKTYSQSDDEDITRICIKKELCVPPFYKIYTEDSCLEGDEVLCEAVVLPPLSCGNALPSNDVPWLTSVLKRANDNNETLLGVASLIHHGAVLTAAHIINSESADELVVRLGAYISGDDSNIRKVVKIFKHPENNNQHIIHDLAILILDSPIEVTSNFQPICLPQSGQIIIKDDCFFAGWKVDRDEDGKIISTQVRKVPMFAIRNDLCQQELSSGETFFHLSSSLMCAIGNIVPTQKPCKGDGGGPLFCPIGRKQTEFVIVGVASLGSNCEDKNSDMKVSVFTRIQMYTNWVNNVLGKLQDGLNKDLVL